MIQQRPKGTHCSRARLKQFVFCFSILMWLHIVPGKPRLYAQDIPGIGSVAGLVSRAIKAIDLKIQRLQNKTIGLQNAQKVIENAMTKLHLQEISDWTRRQKELYAKYFQELWQVKSVLTTYWKVKDIIQKQLQLVAEYNRAWARLKADPHFTLTELSEMYRTYSAIIQESLSGLDQLMLACNGLAAQMSDGKRLALIAKAGRQIEKNLADLRRFNTHNYQLGLGRAAILSERILTQKLYGLP